jgi:hypothetical protein
LIFTKRTRDILILYLSTETGARKQLRGLIGDIERVDAALGLRTSFMVFGPSPEAPMVIEGKYSSFRVLGGEALSTPQPLRTLDEFNLGPNYIHKFRTAVERSKFSMMTEIIDVAAIDRKSLPCLVLFFRGIPYPLTFGIASFDTSVKLLGLVRRFSELHDETMNVRRVAQLDDLRVLSQRLKYFEGVKGEQEAKTKKAIMHFKALHKKYKLPDAEIEGMITAYAASRFGDVEKRLVEIVGDQSHGIFIDHRMPKLVSLTQRLAELQAQSASFALELEDVLGRADQYREKIARVAQSISHLHVSLESEFGAMGGLRRINASNLDVWTSLLEKAAKYSKYMTSLAGVKEWLL